VSCWRHRFSFPRRELGGVKDFEICTTCGFRRISKFQAGHFRPGISSAPIFTEALEQEILQEQAEIRRREEFWR